ncbi:alpha/beta fold hydrolase [Psychromonas sp. KJ10-10]|uniref:alpha/beta fold hydrolase n=1 Tax=Psychromonas sp. KJ10-10 TaxID=3391823 RepID=UPI0039B3BAC6
MEQTESTFFSLKEIKEAPRKTPMPLQYIQASDETSLAFRAYLPEITKAVLIFYHGGGAHSGLSYQHIGAGLSEQFNTAVYTPDIRGHGSSGGERGDAPNDEQVWVDINSMLQYVRSLHKGIPVFIGGHSSGAGLVLNYACWEESEAVEGYVFVAPFFGFRSETAHDKGQSDVEFSTVKVSSFVINSLSGGLFAGHSKAVQFHYPQSVLQENPEIVTFNTVNMSKSVTPYAPDKQLSTLKQFGLWIGDKDEAFDPDKIVKFADQNSDTKANKEIIKIDELNHFSILIEASKYIGPWINNVVE